MSRKSAGNYKAFEEKLAASSQRFQEQIATGKQMIHDLNTEMEKQAEELEI